MSKDTRPADTSTTDRPPVEGTTARLILPAEEFAFAPVFERIPDVRIKLEPTAATLTEHALVNVIANERDRDEIESALGTDPATAAIECVAERTDGWTYRLRWDGRARTLMQQFVTEDATLLSAQGREHQWDLHILTPDRHTLSHLYETIADLDYTITCRSISSYHGGEARSALTDKQREALATAYEAGYYDIPQRITADELADQLDISHQALSERLHRAYQQLVGDELVSSDG